MNTIYIVGTPIGNLGDITKRAVTILQEVEVVATENTMKAKKLLTHIDAHPKYVISLRGTTPPIKRLLGILGEGRDIALLVDAGTPGVSDPGGEILAQLRKHIEDIIVIPIPGVSALTTFISICEIPTHKFTFIGFLPTKNKREKYLQEVADSPHTVFLFESPHRLLKTLDRLQKLLEDDRVVVVGRELTKIYEEVVRGSAEVVYDTFAMRDKVVGECIIGVSGKKK